MKANERARPRWNEMDCIMTKHPIFNSIRSPSQSWQSYAFCHFTWLITCGGCSRKHKHELQAGAKHKVSWPVEETHSRTDFNKAREILKLHWWKSHFCPGLTSSHVSFSVLGHRLWPRFLSHFSAPPMTFWQKYNRQHRSSTEKTNEAIPSTPGHEDERSQRRYQRWS